MKQGSQVVLSFEIEIRSTIQQSNLNLFFQSCVAAKKSGGDTTGEQAMKEEKDTKIQVYQTIFPILDWFPLSYVNFVLRLPRLWRNIWRGREKS